MTGADSVAWFREGRPVDQAEPRICLAEAETRYRLVLDPARLADAGTYRVVAENNCGQTVAATQVEVFQVLLN